MKSSHRRLEIQKQVERAGNSGRRGEAPWLAGWRGEGEVVWAANSGRRGVLPRAAHPLLPTSRPRRPKTLTSDPPEAPRQSCVATRWGHSPPLTVSRGRHLDTRAATKKLSSAVLLTRAAPTPTAPTLHASSSHPLTPGLITPGSQEFVFLRFPGDGCRGGVVRGAGVGGVASSVFEAWWAGDTGRSTWPGRRTPAAPQWPRKAEKEKYISSIHSKIHSFSSLP
ncbi:hypothetical protein E2C01_092839 [Portunus trituberculatus]|uniref:Uncharacterized protein n=1 Tax=Portunus trituberculatus TaxID=210409 RepID=A0A5B7JLB2_PORTR|nr:hypothetical protein [Portunus trituberculatus]